MLRIIYTLLFISTLTASFSQIPDSVVTGNQNANDVYYSFINGVVKTEPASNWDLAFEIAGFSASIRINHVKGYEVYQTHFASSAWNNVDTALKSSWKPLYNSHHVWTLGAFNRHTDGNFDLGWGVYNPGNHIIQGDSIYVLKAPGGKWMKITFLNLNSGTYNFKYAALDGSNEQTGSVSKAAYKNKNFVYWSFAGNAIVDREPNTAEWDLLFTKYLVLLPEPYAVAGVWTNKGAKTAKAANVSTTINDYSPYYFSDTATVIGYDWKSYNGQTNSYDIENNLVYFVKNAAGGVYKLIFTGYKGGNLGTFYFSRQPMLANIKALNREPFRIMPNPSAGGFRIQVPESDPLIQYELIDGTGSVVLKGTDTRVAHENLAPGVYTLRVISQKGIQTLKFIQSAD